MALSGIPLKLFGTDVGAARINDDGTMDLIMNPNQLGIDMAAAIERGDYSSLTIVPTGIPAPPQPANP
jgi:hypothetical protein